MAPPGAPGHPRDGHDAAVDVVLSAERVDVGVRRVPRERVRVRREVVTEEVTLVVAVRREVLRVEREPLQARTDAQDPGDPLPLEVVLSEERPVVHLEVVPYERVRVGLRAVPGSAPVDVERRREVADLVEDPPAESGTASRTDDARSTP
ncbi:DUF2382 domain-containing protein [Quadrisphaera setariae]|uniref:DUF2382 domain-containing protein n=1 Tax=Quadrisphaera setariae TaxID=2593304 RepID=UPI00165062C5|nr:DUF2382 domain-containing protein [Quadrisphaera setariae]